MTYHFSFYSLFLLLLPLLVISTKSEYDKFKITDSWWIERQSMYSPSDINGSHEASISFNLTFSNLPSEDKTITVAIFPHEHSSNYGNIKNQSLVYCDGDNFFFNYTGDDYIKNFTVNKNIRSISGSYNNINFTSIYTVVIGLCQFKDKDLSIEKGSITFLNAYGYLPGSRYRLLSFFGVFLFMHLALAIAFAVLMIIHRLQLLKLQYGLLAIILLGFFEMIAGFVYYKRMNQYGTQKDTMVSMVFFIGISLIKKTFARFLLLILSMGFGVVKYTLGETKKRIWLLTASYFIFSAVLEIIDTKQILSKVQTISNFGLLMLVIPVSISDTIFLYWTFVSLIRTMQQLTLRRQVVKIQLYKKFIIGLSVSALVSFVIIMYQLISNVARKQETTWKNQWVIIALWNIVFFGLLSYFSFLWRPTKNNTRYGYAELYAEDDDDNDGNQIQLESINVSTDERKNENERNVSRNEQDHRSGQYSMDNENQKME